MRGMSSVNGSVSAKHIIPNAPVHNEIRKLNDETLLLKQTTADDQQTIFIQLTKNEAGIFDLTPYSVGGVSYDIYLEGKS